MQEVETVGLLKKLGFAEYEARAYLSLLQRHPLTGYELAKLSGVPRADIYSVLQRLEDRGAILRLEDSAGTRYSPAPPEEVMGRLEAAFKAAAEETRRSLEQVGPPTDFAKVWNVVGRTPLLEHAGTVVDHAERSLMLAVGPDEAAELDASVRGALERGVEVATLCTRACPVPCGHCQGGLHRHHLAPESSDNWLIVVRDGQEVVAGIVGSHGEAAGIRSTQQMVVDMAIWQLRHGIALAAVLEDAGPSLEGLLRPETRSVLASVGPRAGVGWLEYMRSLAEVGRG